jgi:hypothetical protein
VITEGVSLTDIFAPELQNIENIFNFGPNSSCSLESHVKEPGLYTIYVSKTVVSIYVTMSVSISNRGL